MRRRLLVSYLTITALILALLVIPLGITFAQREKDELTADLERDATVLASLAEDGLERSEDIDYQALATEYESRTGARVVIVDAEGISVADTQPPTDSPRDFSTRPEFEEALVGERSDGTRRSETLGTDLLYVAVPVASGGVVHGAVRVTYPTSEVEARVRESWLRLGALSLTVLVVVAGVGIVLARSVARPVSELEAATTAMATGDLTQRVPVDRGPPELRSLGKSFNDMAGRLDDLVRAQQAFVADASHQLRTPLTALRLRLENVQAMSEDAEQPDLDAAIEEISRLSRLVDGLLLLARADGGQPACEATDLVPIAAERQRTWEPLAQERRVDIRLSAPDHAATVLALPGAVEQILDNLIDNAVDVSPPGGSIDVSIEPDGQSTIVHVVDHGPGLDEDARARAFDRFWRSPDAPSGGSGLGLAVVRQLANQCDADVQLREHDEGGVDAQLTFKTAPSGPER
jgi:signal transduction histidine kinase